tara:strand:- start:686 stop:1612 length:927 start_codon:yes stop_codon:yes gene_type:complete
MNKEPKITIIIPCKNAGKTIQRTFDSIRSQNYKNLECIVMDGNSNDNTMEIVNNNLDIVYKAISEDDDSGASACNKAIDICTGDIIGFLYADDYLSDNALNDIANAVINFPNNDVYSYGLSIEDLYTKKIIFESYSKKNINLCLDNVLFKHVLNHFYRNSVFKKCGLLKPLYFDDTVFYSNDREFLIRLCLNNLNNHVIEKILYRMTFHKDSYTGSRKNIVKIREEHIGIADHFIDNYDLSDYKKNKLISFKSHNLSLLICYYIYKLDFENFKKILKVGLDIKGYNFFIDIFKSPVSEIIYRASVKKW